MNHAYCDDCGSKLPTDLLIPVPELPRDIASANAGESAVLCRTCCDRVHKTKLYIVPVTWQMAGWYYIEAQSEDEAVRIANERALPLPGEYITDTFQIEHDSVSETTDGIPAYLAQNYISAESEDS